MAGVGWSVLPAAAGVGCGVLGAWVGQRLGGSVATAGVGAAVGAVSGSFAPGVASWLSGRAGARHRAAGSLEVPHALELPSRLLDPARGVVDFTGRDDELAALVAWCEDDAAPRLRLVTGPGGTGKTRLALWLCDRLRELGWRCEWVGDQQEAGVIAGIRAVTSGRLLLVVDYAETRVGLAALLRAVTVDDGAALRVLLLARSAGQWWEQLGAGEAAVRDLIAAAGPEGCQLGQVIDATSTDEELILQAVPFFAQVLEAEPPKRVRVTLRAGRARVLELHAAALVLVLDSVREPGSDARVDLAEVLGELLKHEERFWLGSARALGLLDGPAGLTTAMLRQIVAVGSLLGAADEREALDMLSRVGEVSRSARACLIFCVSGGR